MKKNTLPPAKMNERPQVLLIGNGLNRAFGAETWEDLLGDISCITYDKYDGEDIEKLNFPLQAVVLTGDNVDEGLKDISEKLVQKETSPEYDEIIREYVDIGFDAILTTNYTYDIEKGLNKDFRCEIGKVSKFRKKTREGNGADEQFGLFKYMMVDNQNIWHIHGEAARIKSMVLDHYNYGKLLACLQKYMAGLIKRYKVAQRLGNDFIAYSWIDYFMIGDVYIVGLGLDQSEMDLWWLINCKKRHRGDLNSGSIIWFEPNMNDESMFSKNVLAECNNISVETKTVGTNDFNHYYKYLIDDIKLKMKQLYLDIL